MPDYKQMLDEYLQRKLSEQKRMDEPSYRFDERIARGDYYKDSLRNMLAEAASKTGAAFGTVGGVSPKSLYDRKAVQQDIDLRHKPALDKPDGMHPDVFKLLTAGMRDEMMGKRIEETAQQKEADRRAKEAEKAKDRSFKAGEKAKDRKAREGLAKTKASLKPKKDKEGGHRIGSMDVRQIGVFDSALDTLDNLYSEYKTKASGVGSGIKSLIPGTEISEYENNKRISAQTIGKILEGGKLTEADLKNYMRMLPDPWDKNNVAEAKYEAMKRQIESQKKETIGALGASGYDVSGFEEQPEGTVKGKYGKDIKVHTPTDFEKKYEEAQQAYMNETDPEKRKRWKKVLDVMESKTGHGER